MKKILVALLLLTIIPAGALAQSNPPLSNKRIRMKGQAAPPTPDPPTGYYNLWVDSATGALNITNSAGTDTPVGAGITGLNTGRIPMATSSTAIGDSKMLATVGGSSTGKGVWTLYDDTATNGITSLVIKEGEADVNSNNYLLKFMSFGGANRGGVVAGINEINFRGDRYNDAANNNFQLGASSGLALIDTVGVTWSNGSYYNAAHSGILPSASGIVRITNGSTGFGSLRAANVGVETGNGAISNIQTISESITLNTGGTTTDSSADLLPANSIILSVVARVTTTITTATDWNLQDPTTANRFLSPNSTLTAGTTAVGLNHLQGGVATDGAGPVQIAAAKLRIVTTGTPGAGVIRVTVTYLSLTPPTS